MGRPPLRKKGPMTAAERQRRHRRKVKIERRQAEIMAARERNSAVFKDPEYQRAKAERDVVESAKAEHGRQEWIALYGREPLPDAGPADEIARQIDECLAQQPDITIDDVRAAIDRRFG